MQQRLADTIARHKALQKEYQESIKLLQDAQKNKQTTIQSYREQENQCKKLDTKTKQVEQSKEEEDDRIAAQEV